MFTGLVAKDLLTVISRLPTVNVVLGATAGTFWALVMLLAVKALTLLPIVVGVRFNVNVQVSPMFRLAPTNLNAVSPPDNGVTLSARVTLPPVQVVLGLGGFATTKPAGGTSGTTIFVRLIPDKLATVIVAAETPFTGTVEGTKALVTLTPTEVTAPELIALAFLPPWVVVIELAGNELVNEPPPGDATTSKVIVQLAPAFSDPLLSSTRSGFASTISKVPGPPQLLVKEPLVWRKLLGKVSTKAKPV
jgi:hypothetical protein